MRRTLFTLAALGCLTAGAAQAAPVALPLAPETAMTAPQVQTVQYWQHRDWHRRGWEHRGWGYGGGHHRRWCYFHPGACY